MNVEPADRRREVSKEIHLAVDVLLQQLKFEQVGALAADLTELAVRPTVLLQALSFARAMVASRSDANADADADAEMNLEIEGGGHGTIVEVEEGSRRLDAVSVTASPDSWADSELLGPEAMIERLGVSRSTLHNWRRDARVIALRKGLRNHLYPVRQFAGKAPLPGVAEVLAVMADPEEAWEWLTVPNVYTQGEQPLTLLERGQVDEVRRAAGSALDFV